MKKVIPLEEQPERLEKIIRKTKKQTIGFIVAGCLCPILFVVLFYLFPIDPVENMTVINALTINLPFTSVACFLMAFLFRFIVKDYEKAIASVNQTLAYLEESSEFFKTYQNLKEK